MQVKQDVPMKFKTPCLIIGVSHLVLLIFSLYERIWELIKLEEPFQLQDHTVVLTSHVIQIIAIGLLICGSVTGNTYYIIPWLICTALLFLTASVYAVLYMSQDETSQKLINFLVIGVIWATWYIVLKFHLENRIRKR
ncbi:hypothetical protein NQ315_003893 [Exocentrus adspersus]|uniref:Uncharacterized protein n=1 Tax=Exocentrus adspersus TaxID=1586481 RepID=A0AAV8VYK9_9CUCU|nr:hypothetical protein NQ315_003893 [Exocentrus adspersus]